MLCTHMHTSITLILVQNTLFLIQNELKGSLIFVPTVCVCVCVCVCYYRLLTTQNKKKLVTSEHRINHIICTGYLFWRFLHYLFM